MNIYSTDSLTCRNFPGSVWSTGLDKCKLLLQSNLILQLSQTGREEQDIHPTFINNRIIKLLSCLKHVERIRISTNLDEKQNNQTIQLSQTGREEQDIHPIFMNNRIIKLFSFLKHVERNMISSQPLRKTEKSNYSAFWNR